MVQIIRGHVLKYFHMYIRKGIGIAFFVFFLSVLIESLYEKKRKREYLIRRHILIHSATLALLAMYIYVVIEITLLSRSGSCTSVINFHITNLFSGQFYKRMFVYENILLFIPLSILLFILAKPFRNIIISLLTGLMCSLLIEVIQLLTLRGKFELEDILANVMGIMFGFLFCRAGIEVFKKIKD